MKDWKGVVLSAQLILLCVLFVGLSFMSLVTRPPNVSLFAWGLVGVCLTGVAAVAVRERERRRAATVAVVCCAGAAFFGMAVLSKVFLSARAASVNATCISNVKQLSLGVAMYASDNDDRLPPANKWRTLAKFNVEDEFRCPEAKSPWTYAMNASTSGLSYADIVDPAPLIVLFEADAYVKDAFGSEVWFARRHGGTVGAVAYADGHAGMVSDYNEDDVKWSP